MSGGKSHRALAGIADVYALSWGLGSLEALIGSLSHRPIPVLVLLFLSLLIVPGTVVYHVRLSTKAPFLTPGEVMLGRTGSGAQKEWGNPYGKNRAGLLILTFLTLIYGGNAWDELGRGGVYDLGTVLSRTLVLVLLLAGLMALGAGRRIGAFAVAGFYVVNGRATQFTEVEGIAPAISTGLAVYSYVMALVTGLVVLPYQSPKPSGRAAA